MSYIDFGNCENCNAQLEPVSFIEEETKLISGMYTKTGRYKKCISHLTCPICLRNYPIDDSYDSKWIGKEYI